MTNEEILAAKEPSRELDAVAGHELFGLTEDKAYRDQVPYSYDIRLAFQLQDRIEELGLQVVFAHQLRRLLCLYTADNVISDGELWVAFVTSALDRVKAAILAVRRK